MISVEGRHTSEAVRGKNRIETNRVEGGIVVAEAWRMHAVHTEPTRQQFGRSDHPVVLGPPILDGLNADDAVSRGGKLIVGDDGWDGVFVMFTAVTAAEFVIAVELMVQFHIELPLWMGTNDHLPPVWIRICRVRYVGHRIQIQDRLPDGIDLGRGDFISGKLSMRTRRATLVPGARIIDASI